jgi:hypothetical protein
MEILDFNFIEYIKDKLSYPDPTVYIKMHDGLFTLSITEQSNIKIVFTGKTFEELKSKVDTFFEAYSDTKQKCSKCCPCLDMPCMGQGFPEIK